MARVARMNGTWRGSRGWTPAGDACRGARRKTEEEESEGLTGGPGGDFHFLFPFFFQGCDNSPPLRKSRPEI